MSSPSETPRGLERGETVGRFVLLGLLGRGGMGEVYAAYDPELDRKVAVKLLRARSSDGESRLLREAQAIAKLSHPNVVVVYEVGKFHDTVFIAMEFVDGHTLGYWMHAAPRPWREVLRLFQAAGRGLSAAHDAGMIHRDFKPDNVMLTKDGQVRVMDFGLARQVGESSITDGGKDKDPLTISQIEKAKTEARAAAAADPDLESTRRLGKVAPDASVSSTSSGGYLGLKITQTGAQVGTPAYMAPEQFIPGRPTDARTDQFSFCVALYEALYGQRPFAGDTLVTLTVSVLQGEVRPIPEKTRVPGWIRRVLQRGLATDPGARFPSMAALLAALEKDPAVRHRKWATGVAAAALMGGLALAANRIGSGSRTVCASGGARFAGVWEAGSTGSPRKGAIRSAFSKTGKSFAGQTFVATARLLDEYVGRWAAMYRDACEATHVRGDQSAEVMDLRMSCLNERLGNVRALTEVFIKADDGIVLNAVSAAGALPPLDGCADVSALRAVVKPPEDPATKKRVDELRDELARFVALRDSGQCAESEKKAGGLIEAVRATNYRPLLAETLNATGYLGNLCGDPGVAIGRLKEAYSSAIVGHHDRVAVEAAVSIPVLAVNRLGQPSMARDWLEIGRAGLERLGKDGRLEGFLLTAESSVRAAARDFDGWVSCSRKAYAVTRAALGQDNPLPLTGLANIGDALSGAGRFEEALAADREARAETERVLGPSHPLLGNITNNECEALNRLGRFAEASATCQLALSIWRAAGTGPAIVSFGQTGLGMAFLGEGRAEDAIAPLETAVASRVDNHLAPELIGESRFGLARALWARRAARPRALALAKQARADSTSDPKAVAAIDAWLAKPRAN
jgi:serine/threonine protein kinase/tetratricopeptide (TPR) repeat protein